MKSSVTLSTFINSKLRVYQYAVPMLMALAFALLTAILLLFVRVTSDQSLLREISPHVSSLVETQDRSELVRLIKSIADERKSEISLVKDNKIIISSRSLNQFDTPYNPESALFDFSESQISQDFISSRQDVVRPDGPKTDTMLVLNSPLSPILLKGGLTALIMMLLGFGLSFLFTFRIKKLVQDAIRPIQKIDNQIRNLKNLDQGATVFKTGISEFDVIQGSILETQRELAENRDIKAFAKAKEMTAEVYQRLIHDLETPLSALQQMLATANTTEDLSDKQRASAAIPKLASQIVSQIKSSKENLDVDIEVLMVQDVRECIEESISQTVKAKSKDCTIKINIPDSPVIVPHNPNYLNRAISNLVANAIQASKKKVEISLLEVAEKIIIRIEDDGIGVNPQSVSEFLLGKGKSTKSNRRAYGLASANHIIRLHGGRIVAKPSQLGGACFEVCI